MYESAGITQTYGANTYHIVRGENGVACYQIDSTNLGFYVALTTDQVTDTQKMIAVTNFNSTTHFSGTISDYKFITIQGKNTDPQNTFIYTTQNDTYAYFVGFGTETSGNNSYGSLRLAIGLTDFSIFEFIPEHETDAGWYATKSFKINEETNDITYASVGSTYTFNYISGKLVGSDFVEEIIEDNKLLIGASLSDSDVGTSVGNSNYYSVDHWYFRMGRDFEPFLGGYDISSGQLRDIVNDIAKTYGITIAFNDDKTVSLLSKFSYDKDYTGSGDIINLTDSDIINFQRVESRKAYEYTKLTSDQLVKIADNAEVYTADIGGDNVFDINTGLYVDVISEDVVNIRHRTFNDELFLYKISLNNVYHFLECYDIVTIVSDTEERNGNFVIIEVSCNRSNTDLIICRYTNNFQLLETGDFLLLETGDKLILEL